MYWQRVGRRSSLVALCLHLCIVVGAIGNLYEAGFSSSTAKCYRWAHLSVFSLCAIGGHSKMADATRQHHAVPVARGVRCRHTSDPGEGTSGVQPPSKRAPKKAPVPIAPKSSREELRHHKVLEKAVLKAQQFLVAILCTPSALHSPQELAPQPRRDLSLDHPTPCGLPPPAGTEPLFQALLDASAPNTSGVDAQGLALLAPAP